MKTSLEVLHLLDNSSLDAPFSHSVDVFLLVLLRHANVLSVRLQFPLGDLSGDILVDGEGQVERVEVDLVVVFDPLETPVEFGVERLQIAQRRRAENQRNENPRNEIKLILKNKQKI